MLAAGLLLLAGAAAALPLPALPPVEAARCVDASQVATVPALCTSFEGGSDAIRWPYIWSGPPGIICWQADVDPGSGGTSDPTVRYVCCLYNGQDPHPLYCFESTTRVDTA